MTAVEEAAAGAGSVVMVVGRPGRKSTWSTPSGASPVRAAGSRGFCDDLTTSRTLGPFAISWTEVGPSLASALRGGADRDRSSKGCTPSCRVVAADGAGRQDVHWADEATVTRRDS